MKTEKYRNDLLFEYLMDTQNPAKTFELWLCDMLTRERTKRFEDKAIKHPKKSLKKPKKP
jgi:hypothetical protein